MPMPKGHKSAHGYSTTSVFDGGLGYREIAEAMTAKGQKMNHSTARHVLVHALDKIAAARAAQQRSPSGGRAKVGFGTEPSLVGENYDAVGASKPKQPSPGSPFSAGSPVLGKVGSYKKGQAMSYSMFALDAIMIQPVVAPVMTTFAVDSTRTEPSDGFSSRSEDPAPPPPPPPLVALEEPPPPPPPPPEDEPLI